MSDNEQAPAGADEAPPYEGRSPGLFLAIGVGLCLVGGTLNEFMPSDSLDGSESEAGWPFLVLGVVLIVVDLIAYAVRMGRRG